MNHIYIKKRGRVYHLFIILSVFILGLYSIFAINFGDSSPDVGEADQGRHVGTFSAQGGTYADTQTDNSIYFSVERGNNGAVSVNQSLSFNVSVLSTNSSLKIIGINGTLAYCHSRRTTGNCAGGLAPQGTPGRMIISILNATSGNFVDIGNITPTTSNNLETIRNFNTSTTTNYSQYINSTGFITVMFGFYWSGTGRASFLNDHTNLTIIYDARPVAFQSSPANGTSYTGVSNVSLKCNATDDVNLFNITLYHNINGTYARNSSTNVSGTLNSTTFNFTDVPIGNYTWNCQASDNVTTASFATNNFTFTISDNIKPGISFAEPTPVSRTNQTSPSVLINTTVYDLNSGTSTCILDFASSNTTMNISGGGANVSCYLNKSGLADGTYTYRIYANDTVGNLNVSETRTVSVDRSGPVITFVSPSDGNGVTISRNNTFVNVTITDLLEVTLCILDMDGTNTSMAEFGNSSSAICYLNSTNLADGTHTYKVYANDSLGNMGVSATRTVIVSTIVSTPPTVSFVSPTDPDNAIISNNITFINVTAISIGYNVSSCTLNFNGTNSTMNMSGSGLSISCFFNKTGLVNGNYTYRVYANDTLDSLGTSGSRVIIIDSTSPSINFVDPTYASGSNITTGSVTINVTSIDTFSSITDCILDFNDTNETMTIRGSGSNVSCRSIKSISLEGSYSYKVYSNDTLGNLGVSETRTLNLDLLGPNITFDSSNPVNNYNSSTNSASISATAIDNVTLISSCTLDFNGTNSTMSLSGVGKSVTCSSTQSSLASGSYSYKVYSNDSSGNLNVSETRILVVDLDFPNFISLTTQPADENSIDPGFVINLTANVTDNTTLISTVILQYKLNTSSTYTNVTMTYNSSLRIYNASFNASTAGGYDLRLMANDSANNLNYSNAISISVLLDNTWARTPAVLSSVSALASQNISIGIITLNNTGDSALNFSISSNYLNTSFNTTFPVSLNASEIRQVNVSAIAPSSNSVTNIVLTINATPNAIPLEQTTNVTLVVSADAFLSAIINTYPTSVTQGDTLVSLKAVLENIGKNNATNVSFFYTLPAGWTVTSGTQNVTVGDLSVGETAINNIEVSIATNASTGTQTVTANSTGNNVSGVDLSSFGKIEANSVSVTVNAPSSLGTAAAAVAGGSVSAGEFGGSSGGSSVSGGAVTRISDGQTIYTTSFFEHVRGSSGGVPISISNLYENSVLEDIKLEVTGFLSQYVKLTQIIDYNKQVYVETNRLTIIKAGIPLPINLKGIGNHTITANRINPDSASFTFKSSIINLSLFAGQKESIDLDNDNKSDIVIYLKEIINGSAFLDVYRLGPPEPGKLYFGEERNYSFEIFAPPYLHEKDFNLTLKITGNIVAVNPKAAGFVSKPLIEYRKLIFRVTEYDVASVLEQINKARKSIEEMSNADFPTTINEAILSEAELAYNNSNYLRAYELSKKIIANKGFAFDADGLIIGLQSDIKSARLRLLKTPKSEESLALALNAFAREDFEAAFNRAQEARIVFIEETKGKLSIWYILGKYWWAIILGIIVSGFVLYFGIRKLRLFILNVRLNALDRDDKVIVDLIGEIQDKYLRQRSITIDDYNKILLQSQDKLNEISQRRVELSSKRISLFASSTGLDALKKEEKELIDEMKRDQLAYLGKGKISRSRFESKSAKDKQRLSQLIEKEELLKAGIKDSGAIARIINYFRPKRHR